MLIEEIKFRPRGITRKIITVVILLAIVAAGATYYLMGQGQKDAVESVLPADALVFLHLNDVEENLKEMASMPFWKAVGNINYDLLIQKGVVPPQQKMFIELIKKQIAQVAENPLAKKIFGREVAFAVYEPGKDFEAMARQMKGFDPRVVEEFLSGVFLVTRIDPDVQFAEVLTRSFSQYGANVTQDQIEYKGEIIRTITIANVGIKIGFVRFGDLLVLGVGDKVARTCIDVVQGSSPSLGDDPQFVQARSSKGDSPAAVGFFDFGTFVRMLETQAGRILASAPDGIDNKGQQRLEENLAKMAGFEKVSFALQVAPVIKTDIAVSMNEARLHPDFAALYKCPPQDNGTIKFIPGNVLGYQWSNCFDLNYYWKEIKKEVVEKRGAGHKIDELEQRIGFSVERDILPAFGDEFGGYLSDILVGGIFPIPKIVLFIEIADRDKAERLLAKLYEQPITMIQEENYSGVAIKYLALPLGEDIQPGYCFLNNYFLATTSRQLLKNSIDAMNNSSDSLAADPSFKKIDFGLSGKNRSVQFIKIGEIVSKVRGIIGWSNEWATAQERKARAFKEGGQKPLEEVRESIAAIQDELSGMCDQLVLLEDEIWDKGYKGEDVTEQKAQAEDLKGQIGQKELELADQNERKGELENILTETKEDMPDSEKRQAVLDEVVYPLMKSLKSLEVYGARMTSEKDKLKSSIILKVAE